MEIRHYKFNRITLDPNKCFGKPCIRGLRMPVASVLSYLSSGMTVDEVLTEWPELELRNSSIKRIGFTVDEVLTEWPELELEDIFQALGYAAWAMEERVVPLQEAVAGIIEFANLSP
jgi:uncharacterized protein (DUF433 family)